MKTAIFVILIQGLSFIPKTVVIHPNTIVMWINQSSTPHNIVFETQRSPFLKKGDKYYRVFTKKGRYKYYCEPHKTMGMVGEILVK